MIKYNYILLFFVAIVFFSCQKTSIKNYNGSKFELSVQSIDDEKYQLNWPEIKSADFIRYEIFRSNKPIPNPTPNEPLQGTPLFTSNNSETTQFIDSLGSSSSITYYRAVAVLKDRSILSDEKKVESNNIILNGFFNNAKVFPEIQYIYFVNGSNFTVYDYKNNTIVFENKILNTSSSIFTFGFNSIGEPELYFMFSSNVITVYDAKTLELKRDFTIGSSKYFGSIVVIHSKLYGFSYQDDKIYIVNINDGSILNSVSIYTAFDYSTRLYSSSDNTQLVFVANNHAGKYSVDGNGNLSSFATIQNPSAFSLNPYLNTISANGNYLVTSNTGYLLGNNLDYLGKISKGSNTYTDFRFTDDESKIIALKTASFSTPFTIDVLSIPDLNSIKTLNFPASNTSSTATLIFTNNASLYFAYTSFDQFTGNSIIVIKKRPL
jgi:hypothetical protein